MRKASYTLALLCRPSLPSHTSYLHFGMRRFANTYTDCILSHPKASRPCCMLGRGPPPLVAYILELAITAFLETCHPSRSVRAAWSELSYRF